MKNLLHQDIADVLNKSDLDLGHKLGALAHMIGHLLSPYLDDVDEKFINDIGNSIRDGIQCGKKNMQKDEQ